MLRGAVPLGALDRRPPGRDGHTHEQKRITRLSSETTREAYYEPSGSEGTDMLRHYCGFQDLAVGTVSRVLVQQRLHSLAFVAVRIDERIYGDSLQPHYSTTVCMTRSRVAFNSIHPSPSQPH
jgi:hypothetical protein